MQYGYVKAIKDIPVANQIDILLSQGIDKEHIYTMLKDIPIESGDTIIVCRLDIFDMTFGKLHYYLTNLYSNKVRLVSVIDGADTRDEEFMKAFGILRDNESNVRARLCSRSRAKAIAAGKKPGAKKAIGPEQEKRIHELLKKSLTFKEISELIGVDIKTFYWWRKRNNM